MKNFFKIINIFFITVFLFSCKKEQKSQELDIPKVEKVFYYSELKFPNNQFNLKEKTLIYFLAKAADYTDSIYVLTNFMDYFKVLDTIKDPVLREKFINNAGPWDRFEEDSPFISGVGKKPLGAGFYPKNFRQIDFYEFQNNCKESPYTFIRKNDMGEYYCIPYNQMFKKYVDSIVACLQKAAEYSNDTNFKKYLLQRANDIATDNYYKSDSIWILLDKPKIDFIIGPIYVTDDKLFNLKYDYQSYLLIINKEWTKKTVKYTKWIKYLQKALPVEEKYRAQEPGEASTITVYDAIYFGGAGKYGGTMFSIILPLEYELQSKFGIKNVQFKNIIEKKFDAIAKKIRDIAIVPEQRNFITANAFFTNALFYEISNSLGLQYTVDGKTTVRKAMKDKFILSDYLKNYLIVLFLAEKMHDVNEITNDIRENYFTFIVNSLRLARFGTANDYGLANIILLNYFEKNKVLRYTKEGIYINFDKMQELVYDLIRKIIKFQGDGDYNGFKQFIEPYSKISPKLQEVIYKINEQKIPVDIIVKQNKDIFMR